MIVSAVVAKTENNVIGRGNDIPWYLSDDLKFFKKTTLNHHIIMGRKTFESIGRPLPKRTNIVITRQAFYVATGCIVVHSLQEAFERALENGAEEVFIIGGGAIYEAALPYIDKLYITEVHTEMEGEVFFPVLNMDEWEVTKVHPTFKANEKNDFDFTIKELARIKKED